MDCDNWVLTIRPKRVTKEEIRKCSRPSCFSDEKPVYAGYSAPPQAYYPFRAQAPPAQTYQAMPRNSPYLNKPQNQSVEDEQSSPLGRSEQSQIYTNSGPSSSSVEYQPNGPIYGYRGGPLSSAPYQLNGGPVYGNRGGPLDSDPYQLKGPVHVYPESSSIPKFLYGLMGRRRK
ncbi:uncharacterized protein LOC135843141 [Planococcus citri]|uniref:uncharacterized protein LOC135843141 n=1 Tax=Planococcus citri TaxID=170843 RepID=UPI0031F85850